MGDLTQASLHYVSTHSRPKAAAYNARIRTILTGFQHTAARRRLRLPCNNVIGRIRFQHTAARRRLPKLYNLTNKQIKGFNTQPPEGGCYQSL